MRNKTLTSILLERVKDEIPYKIEVNFEDSKEKGKEYEVVAKNMEIAIHKVMYLFHSESSKDLSVSDIKQVDEDTYKIKVIFDNNNKNYKEYEIFADDEDEAKMHAMYEARDDLKVTKVNGEKYEFLDDFKEDRFDVNDSLDYKESQWKKDKGE